MSSRRFIALGTASQVPTRDRNHNGYFLRWDAEGFLFDPGEGTQRQMIYAELSASSITRILITHFHGDHCLGLAGIVQRLSLDRVAHKVRIYYPASGEKYLDNLLNASIYHNVAEIERVPLTVDGLIEETDDFRLESYSLDHTTESRGYRIVEKDRFSLDPAKLEALGVRGAAIGQLKTTGKLEIDGRVIRVEEVGTLKRGQSFAFVMDTRLCPNAFALAHGVDMLVCESTYLSSESAEAKSNGHLTAKQAAQIAKTAGVEQLVLTHFSQRYPRTKDFLDEASAVFANCCAVRDGDFIDFVRRPRNDAAESAE